MIKSVLITLLFLATSFQGFSQYSWVFFKDNSITSSNSTGQEISKKHIKKLEKIDGIEILGYSKWFNAACVKNANQNWTKKSYISHIQPLGRYKMYQEFESIDTSKYGSADVQLEMLGLNEYHQMGYTGKGVSVGVFDAGFKNLNKFEAFDSTWKNGQIKDHYDFVINDSIKFNTSMHGTSVLSILGLNAPDSLMGAAPHSNFVLARTEYAPTETHVEEYNWIKALEWADSVGVDIIHSSLGYGQFDSGHFSYTYADMDGATSMITLGTNIAAEKGIFVTNSAGNQGAAEWRYITAPCDGFKVLCVGAVDSFRNKTNFSSFGPSYDGRVKPEVMAMGGNTAHIGNGGRVRFGNGTSFSGPLIAGMVACMKEAHPNATNAHIFEAIIRSAHQYNTPDSAYGYGIPNVMRADTILKALRLGIDPIYLFTNKVNLYPNPTADVFKVSSHLPIKSVHIYNSLGQEIHRLSPQYQSDIVVEISVDQFQYGTYIVQVESAGKVYTKRLVVRP